MRYVDMSQHGMLWPFPSKRMKLTGIAYIGGRSRVRGRPLRARYQADREG